ETWRHSSPMQRSEILRKVGQLSRERAQDIGRNMTLDQGKPLAESVGEVMGCADHCDWHAEECRRIYGRVIRPATPASARSCCGSPSEYVPPSRPGTFLTTRPYARFAQQSVRAAPLS